jgi:threonine dehydratase
MRGAIPVWGVEPEAGDDFQQSLAAGRPIDIALPATIADGLQTMRPGDLTFSLVSALGAKVVTVSDDELRAAVRFAFERLKLVIEPSGAAALAALLAARVDVRGMRVGAIVSGGNVDAETFARVIAAAAAIGR